MVKYDNAPEKKKKKLTGFEQTGAGETKTFKDERYESPTSTTLYPLKAGAYPDFIPKSSFTPDEWKRAVESVNAGEGVFSPGSVINRKSEESQKRTIKPQEEKGFIDKVAEFGAWPSVFMANLISGGVKGVTGKDMGKITTEQFTEKPAGKALGLATVATELALAGAVTKMLVGGIGSSAGGAASTGGKGSTAIITRTASRIGGGGEELSSITTQRAVQALGGGSSNINKLFMAAKELSPASTKLLLTKNAWLKVGAGLVGTSGIMTWLASDNIMQGVSIMTRDLSFSVNSGVVSREEALEILNEAEGWKNRAERFIKINSKVNPLLWPFGKILMTNAKTAQAQIDLQKRNIMMAGLI